MNTQGRENKNPLLLALLLTQDHKLADSFFNRLHGAKSLLNSKTVRIRGYFAKAKRGSASKNVLKFTQLYFLDMYIQLYTEYGLNCSYHQF
jgi:hypothetical protein